ncbi:MAG: YncE family protein, partial [Planctomycetota bacterium]
MTTEGSGSLAVVDFRSGKLLRAFPTGARVSHMVAATGDGRRAFVASIGSGTLTALDLVAGRRVGE